MVTNRLLSGMILQAGAMFVSFRHIFIGNSKRFPDESLVLQRGGDGKLKGSG